MAIVQNITIDEREVPFKASAAIPRIYRARFRRDIFKDINMLVDAINQNNEDNSALDTFTLEVFENIAYIMAKYADASVPDTAEEWLDGFNTFSIYQILPEIVKLWGLNIETDVESKKNLNRVTAR